MTREGGGATIWECLQFGAPDAERQSQGGLQACSAFSPLPPCTALMPMQLEALPSARRAAGHGAGAAGERPGHCGAQRRRHAGESRHRLHARPGLLASWLDGLLACWLGPVASRKHFADVLGLVRSRAILLALPLVWLASTARGMAGRTGFRMRHLLAPAIGSPLQRKQLSELLEDLLDAMLQVGARAGLRQQQQLAGCLDKRGKQSNCCACPLPHASPWLAGKDSLCLTACSLLALLALCERMPGGKSRHCFSTQHDPAAGLSCPLCAALSAPVCSAACCVARLRSLRPGCPSSSASSTLVGWAVQAAGNIKRVLWTALPVARSGQLCCCAPALGGGRRAGRGHTMRRGSVSPLPRPLLEALQPGLASLPCRCRRRPGSRHQPGR